jgi:hypothetical protein
MSQVFKIVSAAVLGVFLLLLIAGLVLPRRWTVEAQVVVHAPPEAVHPFVEDLRKWSDWANRQPGDPTLEVTFSGPERGVGATRSYRGRHAGEGSTTLTVSDPNRGVWFDSKVNSERVNAHGSITYEALSGSTTVTWKDQGMLPLVIGGYLRDSVETGLRQHLDAGLSELKRLSEKSVENRSVPPPAAD